MFTKLPIHIAYGGLALFISLLNNVFLLFYVTTFVSVYHIDGTSFFIGETLFLIWNSINDPLFGWMSDSDALKHNKGGQNSQLNVIIKRIQALSRFGPLFALSFLTFWFHILPVGLQFSFSLCLYDSFLTMVDLHHQALLADLTIKAEDRVRLNSYCSIFSAAGSVSVFVSFTLWDKENLFHFQLFCVGLAAFVCFGFYACCESMKTYYNSNIEIKKPDIDKSDENSLSSILAAKKYTQQVFRHRNFLTFAAMNIIQVFHCHFNSNFFPLFIHHLLGHTLSPAAGAVLIGLSFLVPHLNNLYFLQLCKRYGTYFVIKCLFIVKFVLAFLMWNLGISYWLVLCLFVISNRVFTEGTCKLLNLIISDLVDEDFVKFKRKTPVSALVFGTAALLSKPGQTLAPLLGSYMLYIQTGKSIFGNQPHDRITSSNHALDHDDSNAFKEGCFSVLIFVPIICAISQLFIWHWFSLKGRYLKKIKADRVHQELGYYGICVV